jgi:tetraacyldisaccharide 4'-kinase
LLPSAARTDARGVLENLERRLHPLAHAWYSGARWPKLLLPLSWIYGVAARRRRLGYLKGSRAIWRAPVPVIIVGNITAGGTGKTPLVIWLAERLREAGYQPGIVLRGHGGRDHREPLSVTENTAPDEAGDEAVLLARRAGCPVVAGRDRAAAVRSLLDTGCCDLVISDDGLQHYGLARDVEIAVIDGDRGVGNGLLQPAGPLREGVDRLAEVDWVVSNGAVTALWPEATVMRIVPRRFVKVADPSTAMEVEAFVSSHGSVTAVAGIGNPERFFETLRETGLEVDAQALPDHHRYRGDEFSAEGIVVATEKDAVKLERLPALGAEVWYLEVEARLEAVAGQSPEAKLSGLLRRHGVHR